MYRQINLETTQCLDSWHEVQLPAGTARMLRFSNLGTLPSFGSIPRVDQLALCCIGLE
jgi:hypothetical protein